MSKEVEWSEIHGEGEIVCECDKCGNTYNYEFDCGPDFRACQEEIKSQGWLSRKINNEWHDFCCEECYKKFVEVNR